MQASPWKAEEKADLEVVFFKLLRNGRFLGLVCNREGGTRTRCSFILVTSCCAISSATVFALRFFACYIKRVSIRGWMCGAYPPAIQPRRGAHRHRAARRASSILLLAGPLPRHQAPLERPKAKISPAFHPSGLLLVFRVMGISKPPRNSHGAPESQQPTSKDAFQGKGGLGRGSAPSDPPSLQHTLLRSPAELGTG